MIHQLDYVEFIRRHGRRYMLFYLDPPYFGCEADYGQGVFCRDEFEKLAAELGSIRGRFLMSINDTPGVRECFGAFHMAEATTTYSIAGGRYGAKRVGELLVSNFLQ